MAYGGRRNDLPGCNPRGTLAKVAEQDAAPSLDGTKAFVRRQSHGRRTPQTLSGDCDSKVAWALAGAPSFLARDEVLADYLRDVPVKRNGELVLFDAFDLAVAEHRMMHCVANRE